MSGLPPVTYGDAIVRLDVAKDRSAKVFTSFRDIWDDFRKRRTEFGQVVQYVCDKVSDALKRGESVVHAYACSAKTDPEIRTAVAEVVKLVFSEDSKITGPESVAILEKIISDPQLKEIFLEIMKMCGGNDSALKGFFTKTFDGWIGTTKTHSITDKVTAFEFILARDERDGSDDLKVAMLNVVKEISATNIALFSEMRNSTRLDVVRNSGVINNTAGQYRADQFGGKVAVCVFDWLCGRQLDLKLVSEEPEVFLAAVSFAEKVGVYVDGEDVKSLLTSKFNNDGSPDDELSILQYAALRYGFENPKTIALIRLYERAAGVAVYKEGLPLQVSDALLDEHGAIFEGCRHPIGLPLRNCSTLSQTTKALSGAAVCSWSRGYWCVGENFSKQLTTLKTYGNGAAEYVRLPVLAQFPSIRHVKVGWDVNMEEVELYAKCVAGLGLNVTIELDEPYAHHGAKIPDGQIKAYGEARARMLKLSRKNEKPSIILPAATVSEERANVKHKIIQTLVDGNSASEGAGLGVLFASATSTQSVVLDGVEYSVRLKDGAEVGSNDEGDYVVAHNFPRETLPEETKS
jgi:hypothetical protein